MYRNAAPLGLVAGRRRPEQETAKPIGGVTPAVVVAPIAITRKAGSFTLEECLVTGVERGLVERSEAALRAAYPDEFEKAPAAAGA